MVIKTCFYVIYRSFLDTIFSQILNYLLNGSFMEYYFFLFYENLTFSALRPTLKSEYYLFYLSYSITL